jgi:hypothetical protein
MNYFNNEEKGWALISRKEIVRGNEIHINQMPGVFLDNGFFLQCKGYINPNRATRVPFTIALQKDDPLYKEKVSLMMNRFDRRTFMVGQNLNDESFMNMVFFLRYFAYGGTVENLVAIKMTEVQRKVDAREPFTDQTSFDGTRVQSYSKEMESVVWQMVGSNCDALL